jgi:carboxyl-terminal processing protease
MPYRRLVLILIVILITLGAFSTGYLLGQSEIAPLRLIGPASLTPDAARESFRPFWETWQILNDDFFDQPLNNELLAESAIDGMLAALEDPNTRYLSPDEEEAARINLRGSFEGIGAEVVDENGSITIVAAYEGSPAASAGLKSGDILRQADGVDLTGMNISEVADLVRGPAGTAVHLAIERDGSLFDVDIVRDKIRIPSVRSELLDEGVAYLRLSRFSDTTTQEFEENLVSLMASEPTGLILDLRSNPGGGLSTAVDIADHFLGEGPILIERFGNGDESLFDADEKGLAQDVPLVVLINEGSASASEVVAGAIRDRGRGVLIGAKSFGKGTVQTWRRLSNNGGLRVTVARWLTPDGTWVDNEGLTPDITVSIPESEEGVLIDTQLQRAIEYLLGQPAANK